MGGKQFILFAVLALFLSGCSLLITENVEDDKICITKEKLAELGVSVDDLLSESENSETESMVTEEVIEKTPVESESENTESEETEKSEKEMSEETVTEEETESEEKESESKSEETTEEVAAVEEDSIITKTYTTGDLVSLKPTASDREGDVVTFSFTAPLDENGEWQTSAADAGEYVVTITASDGKSENSMDVKLVVVSGNNLPVIEDIAAITVTAGETVSLSPVVTDEDGDEITISYSGFMTESSKVTTNDDVGSQTVVITANDGTVSVQKTVTVTVNKLNHAPVIGDLSTVVVTEGELVTLTATATDEDSDEVVITYSEPLSEDGTWQTAIGDVGTYTVTVGATDGQMTDSKTVAIVVKSANSAPAIEQDDVTITVQSGETETVTLTPTVTDADGDEVSVSYSGFMTSSTKEVSEDDEGEHIVTITADDGTATTTLSVKLTIEVNTPPSFTI